MKNQGHQPGHFLGQIFKMGFVVGFMLLCGLPGRATAYESFTATVAFYQGVDVTTGMTEIDPTVLTLKFGDTGAVEVVLPAEPFNFSSAVAFHFEYDPALGANPVVFIPQAQIVAMTVTHGADVAGDLTAPFTAALGGDDVIVLKTTDNRYFKLSELTLGANLHVGVKVEEVTPATPEPGTLLLGAGLLGIMGLLRRKK